ncbi:MAG: Unknown protein [uncultured Sulfurovum sp.]|uniref:beta-lactamase n=1 Tax=uncultured Sulfurovum sp. TaxID=269237 RepID=A0A6S6T7P2_9BACT|nr:MAG: Unknown protein [uncultured Sulfurovum sp.]
MKNFIKVIISGSLFLLLGCSSDKTLSLVDNEQVCNNKNFKGCDTAANYYMKKKEYQKAVTYAKIGCNNNKAKSCEVLGKAYLDGKQVKKNLNKGLKFLEKSCTIGDGYVGCHDLAVRYSIIGFGIQKDYVKSSKYFKIACEKGLYAEACYYLAFNYEYGRGMQKNDGLSVYYYRKALDFYKKECKNDFNGCKNVGEMYQDGKGVSKDLKKALEYYHIGCEKNDGTSCFKIGMMYQFAKTYDQTQGYLIEDAAKAKEYYLQACDNKYILGCETFAKLNK